MKAGRIVLICMSFLFMSGSLLAQEDKEAAKLVYKAEKLMFIRNYDDALPILQEAIAIAPTSGKVNYLTGLCYYNNLDVNTQIKSIPHFETAIKNPEEGVEDKVHFYLGQMYHKTTAVQKAITKFEDYKKLLASNDKKELEAVNRWIEQANNAISLISQSRVIEVFPVSDKINTQYTEYNPVVSTDESVIAYTSVRPDESKTKSSGQLVEDIYINYKGASAWGDPELLEIKTNYNVGTAGISADGQKMIVYLGGSGNQGDLYEIEKIGSEWSAPAYLGNTINSNYLESTASITPDGKTIYFASNRPGGYGGLDIYVVHKEDDGTWGQPKNLGNKVNTKADEDAPFIHPDERQLFFTSDGHNSMGGKDIFRTILEGGKWARPENMGYPINTPTNDNYFTLTADGRKGYFSSDRPGGKGGQDIYSINMPDEDANIPLTVIKGKILNGETMEPIPTKILVVDLESGNKIDYVYNPNSETGNYLVILPPGRNYDMIIESDGYTPYTINVNIPNQNYFYELYQQILLSPVKQFDVLVGQEVQVKNAFYDTKSGDDVDPRKANEAMLVRSDSLDLYDIMDGIIASEDTVAFNYFLDLMYTINPVEDVDFAEGGDEGPVEQAKRTYYYDESTTDDLEAKLVDGKTIYSLPTLYVTEADAERRERLKKTRSVTYDPAVLIPVYKVYFGVGDAKMDGKYTPQLEKVLTILTNNPDLGVEISGYASAEGDADFNRKLSNQRAIEVLNFFNHKGVVRRRIIARGFGATEASQGNSEESRRVEVRLVDLNDLD